MVEVRQYPVSQPDLAGLQKIMTEVLPSTPGRPVDVAALVPVTTNFKLAKDRETKPHVEYTVEEIEIRAKVLTPTLKSILDFHPISHPELP